MIKVKLKNIFLLYVILGTLINLISFSLFANDNNTYANNNYHSIPVETSLKIGLFSTTKINCIMFATHSGEYNVFLDGNLRDDIEKDVVLLFTLIDNKIEVRGIEKNYGLFNKIDLIGIDSINSFKIKTVIPEKQTRRYDDNLSIFCAMGKINIINEVQFDKYIACVVESEVGAKAVSEYYKVQSILCRTYALAHLSRHENDGYNLCDEVHCQANHGSAKVTNEIKSAVESTHGLVIVDEHMDLALAAFHSNCGGQTVNSEEVWYSDKSYLKSVIDSFCTKELHACWNKKIPIDQWKNYLIKSKVEVEDSIVLLGVLNFSQERRLINYNKIPLKNIRSDWNLKSTFFNLHSDNQFIYLSGKGYGHGVGLCQEGAMNMAKLGYSYRDILKYYYSGITLLNLNQLSFFRE